MRVIRAASAPHGFNLGINQGAVAGAGIAAHLHQHVVPRWSGDANFLPVVGQTKALPQLLDQTWEVVRRAWRRAALMLERFRALSHAVLGPDARLLIKLGVSPDLVTIVGHARASSSGRWSASRRAGCGRACWSSRSS